MTWDPQAVQAQVTEAIAYLRDVHGPVAVLDWWDESGRQRSWTIPWTRIPTAQHPAILDILTDALEYLTAARDNMDTGDVALAVMQLDHRVQRVVKAHPRTAKRPHRSR